MRRAFAFLATAALLAPALPATGGQGERLQPTNLGPAVNTKGDDVDPFVTADGLSLLYATNAPGTFELMRATRASTLGKWKAGRPLADFNAKDADTRSPYLTRTGIFYFASNRVPDEKFKDLKNFDLFERSGGRDPQPMLQVDTRDDELFPWVTASGREFFFSRRTKEGWRLCVSKREVNGGVGEGKLIEELPPGFHHATLTGNALTMYLQGPLEKERWGLFRTTRKKVGGKWAEPEPLTGLNSPEGETGDQAPCLAAGGTVLYFVSDRPGGQGGLDIWSIPTAKLKTQKR